MFVFSLLRTMVGGRSLVKVLQDRTQKYAVLHLKKEQTTKKKEPKKPTFALTFFFNWSGKTC